MNLPVKQAIAQVKAAYRQILVTGVVMVAEVASGVRTEPVGAPLELSQNPLHSDVVEASSNWVRFAKTTASDPVLFPEPYGAGPPGAIEIAQIIHLWACQETSASRDWSDGAIV
jgi:hypothetical protein